jgi:CBS domain containing-hemolysin-like protein
MRASTLIGVIAGTSLLVSFFCSLFEACLYSVSRSRVETLSRSGDRRGKVLARLRSRIDEAIAAVLILNTVSNTVGAAWIGALVAKRYGDALVGVCSGVFTACVLFLAEIAPKSIGVRFANALAPAVAMPLQAIVWALWPLVRLCVLFTRLWGRNAHISHGTVEDIISLAQLVERQGTIQPHEAQWVTNALRLDELTAYDLMTPNPVVARVPDSMRLRDTAVNADHWRFSRLPVCRSEDPDDIVGVVHRRKVFDALAQDKFDLTMRDLMEKPVFVPETMPAHNLLDDFLKKRRHLFCVKDEAGAFTGVVTLEDVLESLIGREIVDETDLHEDMQAVARRRKSALLARAGKTNPAGRDAGAQE